MKIGLFFALIIIIFNANFYGCKKNEPTKIQQSNTSLQFKFKLNGTLVDHSNLQPYCSHYYEKINDSLTFDGTMVVDQSPLNGGSNDTSLTLCFSSRATGNWTRLTDTRMSCFRAGNYYILGTCSISVT